MADPSEAIAHVRDITPGTTRRVTSGGENVLLCNVGGAIYAIEDLCTHDGGELDQGELEDCRIMCPRHGAYFDVRTGAALTLPAILPVRTFPCGSKAITSSSIRKQPSGGASRLADFGPACLCYYRSQS